MTARSMTTTATPEGTMGNSPLLDRCLVLLCGERRGDEEGKHDLKGI